MPQSARVPRPHPPAPAAVVAPGTFAESVAVVLLTSAGEIALAIERRGGLMPTVRLPALAGARAIAAPDTLRRRLRAEAGLDAAELHVMSRYGIPTGDRSSAAILLAP